MPSLSPLFARAWAVSPAFALLTLVHVLAVPVFLVLALLDPTVVDGVSVWAKPLKFGLSFVALGPSMIWVYSHVRRTRVIRALLESAGGTMLVEAVLITGQAARGRASHFNNETLTDSAVFTVMGAAVGIFSLVVAGAGLILARARLGDGPVALAMKHGVLVMLGGALVGFLMPGLKPGQAPDGPRIGAHTVGGLDGGPGLALLGWSTEHGDLRIAHFLGLHALQVLPLAAVLLAWAAGARRLDVDPRRQRLTVSLVTAAWVGLVSTALVQALRGQSVVAPDELTWSMLAVLVGVPALSAAATLAVGRGSGTASRRASADGGAGGDVPAAVPAAL